MGGCKTYGVRKTYQRTRPPEKFWTPPKQLLVHSVVDLYAGKTEQWHRRGVENVPYEGGPKALFGRGVIREVFLPPLFSTPPLSAGLSGPVRDTPHIAQYLFEIVSQRGASHQKISSKYLLLRYPFCGGGGVSHLHFACSPRGKRSEKGEGVSHPIGHVETPKTPIARSRGVSLR